MPLRRQTRIVPDGELAALLARFEAGTSVDEKKAIRFHHFDSDELERILPDAFEADPSFTASQLRDLLRQALWTCRKNGPLTIDRLLEEARRLAKTQLAAPRQPYSMWTKFRARQMASSPGFRIDRDGVTLESRSHLPAFMQRSEYFLNGHGSIDPEHPVFYGYLIARSKARSEENAVKQMLDAIDLFMALFNMYESWGRVSLGPQRWAEGKLFNGPYHFVFRRQVFLGENQIWYDPNFNDEAWDRFPLDMVAVLRVMPRVRRALSALGEHPMRALLVKVLSLMQNAMSTHDQSHSLLRYWSALEQLYGDPAGREKNYKRIIDRASFAEHDRDIAVWKLRHISRLRNDYVHAGEQDDDLRVMAQYLRMLLSRHVNYLLFHAADVRSHAHWLEVVDLPNDEDLLRARKAVIDQRIALIQGGRRQSQE